MLHTVNTQLCRICLPLLIPNFCLFSPLQITSNPKSKMGSKTTFTLSQIAKHNSKKDCWFVVEGRVLDVTKFLEEHPGGDDVLLESAGKDATKEFKDVGHSKAALNMLFKYQVGVLQGYSFQEETNGAAGGTKEPKTKEMKAFVIKEEPRSLDLLEFIIPLFVAGSYFTYRYINY